MIKKRGIETKKKKLHHNKQFMKSTEQIPRKTSPKFSFVYDRCGNITLCSNSISHSVKKGDVGRTDAAD